MSAKEKKIKEPQPVEASMYLYCTLFVSCRHDDTRICKGEKVHSMDHSMRLLCEAAEFSRHVNIFPAMSTFAL